MRKEEMLMNAVSIDSKDLFYPAPAFVDAVRKELSPNNPDTEKSCQEVQIEACKAFIEFYGEYLKPEQINYLLQPNVIVGDPTKVEIALKKLPIKTRDQNPELVSLNGKMYRGYEVVPTIKVGKNKTKELKEIGAQHFWTGRIASVPLAGFGEVNRAFLETQPSDELPEEERRQAWNAFYDKMPTNSLFETTLFAGMALHEKVHGCQDYDIPLPILEVSAHYYEAETFKRKRWEKRATPFNPAVKYWADLVEEFGSDLHRYIFGNLPKNKAAEFSKIIKARFSSEKMKEIFELKYPSRGERIVWKTE